MEYINCSEGIAYIALTNDLSQILITASLNQSVYHSMTCKYKIINITKYSSIKPDIRALHYYNITNFNQQIELKADIISHNSISLRLYKKNNDEIDCEDNIIPFVISVKQLKEIAYKTLSF